MKKNMNTKNESLRNWEIATEVLADEFLDVYFETSTDCFWVGNTIGGVFAVNDYFFNLDRIVESLRYHASKKKLFEYYEKELEEKPDINFYYFLKHGWPKKEIKKNKIRG